MHLKKTSTHYRAQLNANDSHMHVAFCPILFFRGTFLYFPFLIKQLLQVGFLQHLGWQTAPTPTPRDRCCCCCCCCLSSSSSSSSFAIIGLCGLAHSSTRLPDTVRVTTSYCTMHAFNKSDTVDIYL